IRIFRVTRANDARRIATDFGVTGNRFCDQAPHPDHGVIADFYSVYYTGIGADPHILPDTYSLGAYRLIFNQLSGRHPMVKRISISVGGNAGVIANHYTFAAAVQTDVVIN